MFWKQTMASKDTINKPRIQLGLHLSSYRSSPPNLTEVILRIFG